MENKSFSSAKPGDPIGLLRGSLRKMLPAPYTQSPRYALAVEGEAAPYRASITLDMEADGSSYGSFGVDDLMMLAELEADYLLTTCLKDLPVPADILLRMCFADGEEITVERPAGGSTGTLTWGETQMTILFEETDGEA